MKRLDFEYFILDHRAAGLSDQRTIDRQVPGNYGYDWSDGGEDLLVGRGALYALGIGDKPLCRADAIIDVLRGKAETKAARWRSGSLGTRMGLGTWQISVLPQFAMIDPSLRSG
jgi:hypothetical protein